MILLHVLAGKTSALACKIDESDELDGNKVYLERWMRINETESLFGEMKEENVNWFWNSNK